MLSSCIFNWVCIVRAYSHQHAASSCRMANAWKININSVLRNLLERARSVGSTVLPMGGQNLALAADRCRRSNNNTNNNDDDRKRCTGLVHSRLLIKNYCLLHHWAGRRRGEENTRQWCANYSWRDKQQCIVLYYWVLLIWRIWTDNVDWGKKHTANWIDIFFISIEYFNAFFILIYWILNCKLCDAQWMCVVCISRIGSATTISTRWGSNRRQGGLCA